MTGEYTDILYEKLTYINSNILQGMVKFTNDMAPHIRNSGYVSPSHVNCGTSIKSDSDRVECGLFLDSSLIIPRIIEMNT